MCIFYYTIEHINTMQASPRLQTPDLQRTHTSKWLLHYSWAQATHCSIVEAEVKELRTLTKKVESAVAGLGGDDPAGSLDGVHSLLKSISHNTIPEVVSLSLSQCLIFFKLQMSLN